MSRSYSTFNREVKQPFSDGLKKSTYSPMASSDHLHHHVDAGGRQFPVIRHGSNGETYVIKAEKIVEHRTHVPASRILVSEYRYNTEQPELFRDYGVHDRYSPPVSTYLRPEKVEYSHIDGGFDRPEEVEEFLNEVLAEAGRGSTRPVPVPLTSTWHPVSSNRPIVHENTRKYSNERDFKGDDNRKILNGSEPYLKNKGNYKDGNDFYERPQVNQNPNARNYQLSKPTNEIGPAIEFLKEAIKPSYANPTVQTEANRQPIIKTAVPLATTNWRNGSTRGTKMEANDYASEDDEEEEEEESRRNLHHYGKSDELKPLTTNRGGGLRPLENKEYGYEKPLTTNRGGGGLKPLENKEYGYERPNNNNKAVNLGHTRFPPAGTTIQKKEENIYPHEKIDSKEAGRRHGKLPSRQLEDEKYVGTISSRDALLKYKGALVP